LKFNQDLLFRATEILKQCGPTVKLQVLKNAANQHGLSALFSSSSQNYEQGKTRPLVIREDMPTKSIMHTKSLTPPSISPQLNGYHDQSLDDFDEK
jgi:hypothetical protein